MRYQDSDELPSVSTLSAQADHCLNEPSISGKRRHQLPARYRDPNFTHHGRIPLPGHHCDQLPVPLAPLPPPAPPAQRQLPRIILIVRDTIRTAFNAFGLMREYPHRPSYDPDSEVHAASLATRKPACEAAESNDSLPDSDVKSAYLPPWPHRNMTHWLFMSWLTNGTNTKSQGEATKLINLMKRDDFDPDELKRMNVAKEFKRIDAMAEERSQVEAVEGGDEWQETPVEIKVPTGIEGQSASFTVPGLRFRSLIGIITAGFQDSIARYFHFTPFRKFRRLASGTLERVWDELYTSNAWLDEHDRLQRLPSSDGIEKVIAAIMLWSDATHLAQFGTAKAWPLYLSFGNLSKYIRGQPRTCVAHHVAYIPSVRSDPFCLDVFLI